MLVNSGGDALLARLSVVTVLAWLEVEADAAFDKGAVTASRDVRARARARGAGLGVGTGGEADGDCCCGQLSGEQSARSRLSSTCFASSAATMSGSELESDEPISIVSGSLVPEAEGERAPPGATRLASGTLPSKANAGSASRCSIQRSIVAMDFMRYVYCAVSCTIPGRWRRSERTSLSSQLHGGISALTSGLGDGGRSVKPSGIGTASTDDNGFDWRCHNQNQNHYHRAEQSPEPNRIESKRCAD